MREHTSANPTTDSVPNWDEIPAAVPAFGAVSLLCAAMSGAVLSLPDFAALSVRPEMRAVVVVTAVSCLAIGLCWVLRPWPTRRAFNIFVLCADASILVFALSLQSSLAALPILTGFATIGCYIATFHDRNIFIAHQIFVAIAVAALSARAVSEDHDVTEVFVFAALDIIVLFTAPLMAWFVLETLRNAAAEADYDPLTGVYNRRGAESAFAEFYEQTRSQLSSATTVVIDIDSFKTINDTFGHHAGDRTLEVVAQCLRRHFPPPAIVARTGGEEFAVLTPGQSIDVVPQLQLFSLEASVGTLRQLPKDTQYGVTYSIGAAELPCQSKLARSDALFQELLRAADSAMYLSKRAGGNRITLVSPDADILMTIRALP